MTIIDRDVWVATSGDGRVYRIDGDANRGRRAASASAARRATSPPTASSSTSPIAKATGVVTVDPQAEQVVERETVEDGPLSRRASTTNDLWVTRFDGGDVARIARR